MEFKKYQHIERFGTDEVENIEFGKCYLFPKIDGTNASIWANSLGDIQAGSRKRHLTLEEDNAGFYEWVLKQDNIKCFFSKYPDLRLYGEWLVPHSLKTYKEDAWKKFYVFDVMLEDEYIYYENYKHLLDDFDIDYIPPIAIINNPTFEQLIKKLPANNFLIEDGKGSGEGIVIKRYDFVNKFDRTTWAKIVTSSFKEKHSRTMGAPESDGKKMIEQEIVNEYLTKELCDKVFAKIKSENGWQSKLIPRLLQTVYYDLINEESWNFIKKHKNPTINFRTLHYLSSIKIKEHLTDLF